MYSELLEVAALSSVLTVLVVFALMSIGKQFSRWIESLLLPRYMKYRGVRRLAEPTSTADSSDQHE